MVLQQKMRQSDFLLGALGAFLMLVGDLCLSVIPAHSGDSGLFARETYLNGSWEEWRLPLLLTTGLCGMALGFFSVRGMVTQIQPQYRKTRIVFLVGGVLYLTSAGALHLFIGSLADWTSRLAPILGREEALTLVQAQYGRLMPAMLISYAGMLLCMFTNAFAVLTKKTPLPRWMLAFHLLVVQLVLVLIPDVRQLLGAQISTWDFVLSQGSGNAALCLWMIANAVFAGRRPRKTEVM